LELLLQRNHVLVEGVVHPGLNARHHLVVEVGALVLLLGLLVLLDYRLDERWFVVQVDTVL